MAPAPGTSTNSPVHLPSIAANLDVLLRTESAEVCGAWQWWQQLFTSAADTHVQSIHIEPEHDHFRLRRRGISTFDEELLRSTDTVTQAIETLSNQCWDSEIPAQARQLQYLRLSWQNTTLIISVASMETSRGMSYLFCLIRNPAYRPTLDELGFEGKDLLRVRALLNDAQGTLIMIGSDAIPRAETVRALAQELNSPDRKIVAAETPIHPYLPRINQIVYPSDTDNAQDHWHKAASMDTDAIVAVNLLPAADQLHLRQLANSNRYVINSMSGNDAQTALLQLLADGTTPQWIATTVQAVVVQHRIKTLCQDCFQAVELTDEEAAWISGLQPRMSDNFATWLTVNMERSYTGSLGCKSCHHTGTAQIRNAFEVVDLTPDIRNKLLHGKVNDALAMLNTRLELAKQLLSLAGDRQISIGEAMRVTGQYRQVY